MSNLLLAGSSATGWLVALGVLLIIAGIIVAIVMSVQIARTVRAMKRPAAVVGKWDLSAGDEGFDVEKAQKRAKTMHILKNVLVYVFLTVCALLAFLPFYWMLISSVKTEVEFRESVPTFFPHSFQWKNYWMIFHQATSASGATVSFDQILVNTLVVGLLSTFLGLVIIVVTAYALARMEFKGKNILFAVMLATMMIPGELFTVSNYVTVAKAGMMNSYTVLILPFLVSVYYIYLLRNNFMQIPNSLYQAAKIDGLSDLGYLIKVMIPLTAPTLVSITLLRFIGTWNSYIWPQLVNTPPWRMITNWVTGGFVDRMQPTSPWGANWSIYNGFYGSSMSLDTLKMAAVCMVSLPLLILFIFCRKYIMRGVSKSGTKG